MMEIWKIKYWCCPILALGEPNLASTSTHWHLVFAEGVVDLNKNVDHNDHYHLESYTLVMY